MKLSIRVPLLIIAVVLITSSAIIISVNLLVTRNMEASVISGMVSNSRTNAELLQNKLDVLLNQLWEIANRARTRTMNWEGVVKANFEPDIERIASLDIGLVFPDGTTNYVLEKNSTNLGDRDYIKKAFAGKTAVSDVLISRATGKPVVMLAAPVLKDNTNGSPVVGVIVTRKDGPTFLTGLVNGIHSDYQTSYGFLVNNEGTYMAHPNTELVNKQFNPIKEAEKDPSLKSMANLITKVVKERAGSTEYISNGKVIVCAFTPLSGQDWILIQNVEKSEVLVPVIRIRNTMLLIGLICAALGAIVAIFAGRTITGPLTNMTKIVKHTGSGDLTKRVSIGSKDEIGELGLGFNTMLDNIKNLITTIQQESEHLSGIGEVLAESSGKTASAVETITSHIQSIQNLAVNQSASVTETNATMEQISGNIQKLNDHVEYQTESVSKSSSAVEEMIANTQSVTQTLYKNTDKVNELTDAVGAGRGGLQTVVSDVQEIARESEGLLQINSVMENIASQTNLLSMNAAIEAAHAGEAGKGFAVVAGEIRKLAENSSAQSKTIVEVLKKIKDSISKITKSTDNALETFEAIEGGITTVSNQEENIRGAMEEQGEGSKQILEAIGQLNEITRQVKNSSVEMLEGAKEIIGEGKNLEKATDKITGGMAEIAASADQISAAVSEVNIISGQNKRIIDSLVVAVSRFKV
ncbi:MAG: methyl-accepting chemotaxis protein [Treponema sp.]|jgi:methyl-accepting chemotaxis protein|nr:methyl-accepting chemotaxis protein [Treponema sp.]